MSRAKPIPARALAALIAHAMNTEQSQLVLGSMPTETINSVMKSCPEYQNDAWWDSEKNQMK